MKKVEKAGVFCPINSKITPVTGKEGRKRKSEEGERRRREESNGCTFLGYFGHGFWLKKRLCDGKGPFGGNVFKTPVNFILTRI